MTAQAYGRFYNGIYRPLVSAFHGRLIDARTIQDEQREYAIERASFIRPFIANAAPKTLLDIGGSTGVVAASLREGVRVQRHAHRSGAARSRAGAAPRTRRRSPGWSKSTTSASAASTSCIICQTVDHLLDVAGTLARVRQLLSDNGLLFIDIVDFRAAYLRNWSVEEAIKIDHPYYLTEPTMARTSEALDSTCCGVTTRRTICMSATSAVPAPRTAM